LYLPDRFTSPPNPEAVPMPPADWLMPTKMAGDAELTTIASNLKNMLHIQA